MSTRIPIGRQLYIPIRGRAGMFDSVVMGGVVGGRRRRTALSLEDAKTFETEVDGVGGVGGGE